MNAPDRAAWLETIAPENHDRSKLLGGSDIAAVINVSPWKTPAKLWADKIKPRVAEGPLSNPKSRGIRWEGVVAEMVIERLQADGHDVEIVASNRRYRDAEHNFLAAEIDFEIRLDGAAEVTNVELKTVHPFMLLRDGWGESGSDQMPVHYTAQVMHGLGVTRRRHGMLAALFGADELRVYPVPADQDTIAYLRSQAVRFWHDYVLAGVEPPPVNTDDLLRTFPRELEGGAPLLADNDLTAMLMRLRALDKRMKAAEAEGDALRFEIQQRMRDAVAIVLPNGRTACEWKLREGKSLDHDKLKNALGTKGYREAHSPWSSRVFALKPFAIDGLDPTAAPISSIADTKEISE